MQFIILLRHVLNSFEIVTAYVKHSCHQSGNYRKCHMNTDFTKCTRKFTPIVLSKTLHGLPTIAKPITMPFYRGLVC